MEKDDSLTINTPLNTGIRQIHLTSSFCSDGFVNNWRTEYLPKITPKRFQVFRKMDDDLSQTFFSNESKKERFIEGGGGWLEFFTSFIILFHNLFAFFLGL